MTNRPTLQPIARVGDDPTTRRLRELAAQEAAATKERLATRTAAARLFSGAVARLAEAKAAWERAQAEAQRAQAEAGRGPPRLRHAAWRGGRAARHLEEGAAQLTCHDARAADEGERPDERVASTSAITDSTPDILYL